MRLEIIHNLVNSLHIFTSPEFSLAVPTVKANLISYKILFSPLFSCPKSPKRSEVYKTKAFYSTF